MTLFLRVVASALVVTTGVVAAPTIVGGLRVGPSGRTYVTIRVSRASGTYPVVACFGPDGKLDRSFGGNGVVSLRGIRGADDVRLGDIREDAAGNVYLAGVSETRVGGMDDAKVSIPIRASRDGVAAKNVDDAIRAEDLAGLGKPYEARANAEGADATSNDAFAELFAELDAEERVDEIAQFFRGHRNKLRGDVQGEGFVLRLAKNGAIDTLYGERGFATFEARTRESVATMLLVDKADGTSEVKPVLLAHDAPERPYRWVNIDGAGTVRGKGNVNGDYFRELFGARPETFATLSNVYFADGKMQFVAAFQSMERSGRVTQEGVGVVRGDGSRGPLVRLRYESPRDEGRVAHTSVSPDGRFLYVVTGDGKAGPPRLLSKYDLVEKKKVGSVSLADAGFSAASRVESGVDVRPAADGSVAVVGFDLKSGALLTVSFDDKLHKGKTTTGQVVLDNPRLLQCERFLGAVAA